MFNQEEFKQILWVAVNNAAEESLTTYKGQKVFILHDMEKNECTVVGENNLSAVMQAEPQLKKVCCVFEGKILTE